MRGEIENRAAFVRVLDEAAFAIEFAKVLAVLVLLGFFAIGLILAFRPPYPTDCADRCYHFLQESQRWALSRSPEPTPKQPNGCGCVVLPSETLPVHHEAP